MTDELREAGLLTPEWLALEPKIFENLALVGATGSAAAPLCLDHAWKTGKVKQGDRVMLLAIETSKWKYAGTVFPWTAAPSSGRQPPGRRRCRAALPVAHEGGTCGSTRTWPSRCATASLSGPTSTARTRPRRCRCSCCGRRTTERTR